jgi:hypothetical protein
MSHGYPLNINLEEVLQTEPIQPVLSLRRLFIICALVGALTFLLGLFYTTPERLWGSYYVSLLMWMGLACGGVMIAAIVQIVRAKWSPPIRRITEANVAFLIWAFPLFLLTYFGKETLFPWARAPMPGREWWMQADFVYLRFTVLLAVLFLLMWRFVRLSVRSDIGLLREIHKKDSFWFKHGYSGLCKNWGGAEHESITIQRKLSVSAPVLVLAYVVIYSLFGFEMIMAMDTIWYSNMFGGFMFLGNIYMAWAMLILLVVYFNKNSPAFARNSTVNTLWDIGKLTFGFCMLWGYTFFSQYLPQWYGNLPEETQWLLLRTTGLWQPISYTVFGMCFVMPFILLISEDLKKTPKALSAVAIIILAGMWLEKYVLVMPQLTPGSIPVLTDGLYEIGIFLGFLGLYGLSIQGFMKKYPFIPVSHPLTRGSKDW